MPNTTTNQGEPGPLGDFAGASPRPGLKFPLRAEFSSILNADGRHELSVDCLTESRLDDWAMAAELVRLANLAHEAEAVLALALEGMFHANGCAMNPANVNEHLQPDARCSCGTAEATQIEVEFYLGMGARQIHEYKQLRDILGVHHSAGMFDVLMRLCSSGYIENNLLKYFKPNEEQTK